MKIKLKGFIFCVLLFTAAGFSLTVSAQERQLLPVDEAGKDASFKLFREKLINAVKKRDTKFVLSVVDRNIKNGFGGNDGIENFKKQWKLSSPKSEMWDELLFVLTHGGAFTTEGKSKIFTAPYIFSNFPENLDAFEHGAIVGKNVKLLATPFLSAPSVASLNYSLVKIDYENSIKDKKSPDKIVWAKVETLGGKKGFVPGNLVRLSVDYRAAFDKKRGEWKMIFFLAGD